jgi:hypothetical protein
MKHKKTIALALPVFLFVSLSLKCEGDKAAETQRKYVKALNNITQTVEAMNSLKQSLALKGQITSAENNRLTEALSDTENSVMVAHTLIASIIKAPIEIKSIKELKASDKAALARLRPALSLSLAELDNEIRAIQDLDSMSQFQQLLEDTRKPLGVISKISAKITKGCDDLGGGCFRCLPDPCIYCPNQPPNCPPPKVNKTGE